MYLGTHNKNKPTPILKNIKRRGKRGDFHDSNSYEGADNLTSSVRVTAHGENNKQGFQVLFLFSVSFFKQKSNQRKCHNDVIRSGGRYS